MIDLKEITTVKQLALAYIYFWDPIEKIQGRPGVRKRGYLVAENATAVVFKPRICGVTTPIIVQMT